MKKDSYYTEMELGLKNELGRKVHVSYSKTKEFLSWNSMIRKILSELAKN